MFVENSANTLTNKRLWSLARLHTYIIQLFGVLTGQLLVHFAPFITVSLEQ